MFSEGWIQQKEAEKEKLIAEFHYVVNGRRGDSYRGRAAEKGEDASVVGSPSPCVSCQ